MVIIWVKNRSFNSFKLNIKIVIFIIKIIKELNISDLDALAPRITSKNVTSQSALI